MSNLLLESQVQDSSVIFSRAQVITQHVTKVLCFIKLFSLLLRSLSKGPIEKMGEVKPGASQSLYKEKKN